jgi:glycerol-3-phosphate dehydrogenase
LAGGKLSSTAAVSIFRNKLAERVSSLGLKGDDVNYLVHLYGGQADIIIENVSKSSSGDAELDLVLSELEYSIRNEMVVKAEDFFVRRTGLLYFDLPRLLRVKDRVLNVMASALSWDEIRVKEEKELLEHLIEMALRFRNS